MIRVFWTDALKGENTYKYEGFHNFQSVLFESLESVLGINRIRASAATKGTWKYMYLYIIFGSVQISSHISMLSRYLKSKELWREDPGPGWVIHQVQNAVNPRSSVDGSKQVNPVPVVPRVLTHSLHLLQILIHIISAYDPPTNTGLVSFSD